MTTTRVITARNGGSEPDSVLIEGSSANFFDVVGASFRQGRPFTETKERARSQVAIIGASVAKTLFGGETAVGKSLLLGGDR